VFQDTIYRANYTEDYQSGEGDEEPRNVRHVTAEHPSSYST